MTHIFEVRRDALSTTRIREVEADSLADGHIRLRVDAFAFTANNITYGVAGDRIGYWQFFPAPDGWGVLPVWGFGDVIESLCDGVAVGTRVFGYFPPATNVDMLPTRVSRGGFTDHSAHRRALPAGYNGYRIAPPATAQDEAERMLLFPLHITSWSLWDSLVLADWHGLTPADGQVLVLSASSKTALGLGHALNDDPNAPATLGVTSAARVEMVKGLDLYDEVIAYEDVAGIADRPTVVVDMSGNTSVLDTIADRVGDKLTFISRVGITHWDETSGGNESVRETSKMFFAPGHIAERMKMWGAAEFNARTTAFLRSAALASRDWLEVSERSGLNGLSEVYEGVLEGQRPASEGIIIRM